MKKVKILVLNHSNIHSTYGASTSLRDHFKAFENNDKIVFSCIYRKNLIDFFKFRNIKKEIFNINELRNYWLEINSKCFSHTSPGLIKKLVDEIAPNLVAKLLKKFLIKNILKINPDVIHLNSIVLLPMIQNLVEEIKLKNLKIVLHVRELIDIDSCNDYKKIINDNIDYIVFIDQAVKSKFYKSKIDYDIRKTIVQSNPFNPPLEINENINKYFKSEKKIYAIAGIICEDKGVSFVCEAFLNASIKNAELFVIGSINSFGKELKSKYNYKIKFIGELNNLFKSGAFLKIDCLIRGEANFCIGRTVYESLYSGGYVVMQGDERDIQNNEELLKFKNQIEIYEARNLKSFIDALKKVDHKIEVARIKKDKRLLISNFKDYSDNFIKIYGV